MPDLLSVPQGNFSLQRLPLHHPACLRAWDAADEYLLNELADNHWPETHDTVLIINDSFGALTTALAQFKPYALSDSYLSQQATRLNLRANGQAADQAILLNSLQLPPTPLDLVIIKVTKTLALLEDLLHRLRPLLHPATKIIVAGMLKHLPSSVWSTLERLVGSTRTSLAQKKAKLIFVSVNPSLKPPTNPYPLIYSLEHTPFTLLNHANVFSHAQLDIGTRFFLQHLPSITNAKHIVDLGCGNGVVGLIAATKHPAATLYFIDESFMAVASAQHNFQQAFSTTRHAEFIVADTLENVAPKSMDLILCNPPFHQQQTIGDHLAQKMFQQSFDCLVPQGELWVIGNRHLGYPTHLKKLFGNCQLIANNPKFVIVKAQR